MDDEGIAGVLSLIGVKVNTLILTLRWRNGLAHITADNNIVRSIFYSYLFQEFFLSMCEVKVFLTFTSPNMVLL